MTALLPVARGLGLYVLLCLVATLAGRGLLRLCRLHVPGRAELALAPVLTLIAWTLALGVFAALRLPLRLVTPWVWAATIALAGAGFLIRPRRMFRRAALLPCLVCLALPLVVLARPVKHGLGECLDCMNMDGWFYMAGSHYVHEWGRLPYDGPDPILQLGSHFREHRFITFSLIGHLASLCSGGDVFAVGGLFQAWALFTAACAVALFWLARGHGVRTVLVGTALTVVAGWTADVVWGNWFEQELALAYMPALAAALYLWPAGDSRRWVVLGLLTAGLLYTYPEAALVPLGGVGLMAACCLWHERARWRSWLGGAAFATALTVLLLSPAWRTLVAFTRGQNGSVYTQNVDGVLWLVGGLGQWASQPGAFWGMGGQTFAKPATLAGNLMGAAVTLLALAGLARLVLRGDWGVAAAAGALTAGAMVWLLALHHPYITFKALILCWWLLLYVAAAGAATVAKCVPRAGPRTALTATGIAAFAAFGLWVTQKREPLGTSRYPELHLRDFGVLRQLPAVLAGEPVFVHVHDWLASQLALGMLHEQSLYLGAPRGWFFGPGVVRHRQALPPRFDPGFRLVLTDREYDTCRVSDLPLCARQVWSGGPYTLWRMEAGRGPDPALLDIDPLVTDVMDGTAGKTFWLGHEPTTLHVLVQSAGVLEMAAHVEFGDGAAVGRRNVTIRADVGPVGQVQVASGPGVLRIPVHAGLNQIVLDCPDAPPPEGRWPGPAARYVLCLRRTLLSLSEGQSRDVHVADRAPRPGPAQGESRCVYSSTP
jgi:hypothetical protein